MKNSEVEVVVEQLVLLKLPLPPNKRELDLTDCIIMMTTPEFEEAAQQLFSNPHCDDKRGRP